MYNDEFSGGLREALKRYALIVGAFLLLSLLARRAPIVPRFTIVWAADSYDNDIDYIEVWQWNGSAWELIANFTASEGSVSVVHEQPINFTVGIRFNSTLADDAAEAVSYTRVYCNITNGGSVWTNEELNNTSSSLVGSYYRITEQGYWNMTGYPAEGVSYTVRFLYEGYY